MITCRDFLNHLVGRESLIGLEGEGKTSLYGVIVSYHEVE